jgi:antitoxin component of MazEF toxin-antitoxin module
VERKLFRTGNSLTVTLPPVLAAELRLKAGDMVEIEVDREHDGLLVRRRGRAPEDQAPISPEFAAWVDGFVDRYEDALRKLGGG